MLLNEFLKEEHVVQLYQATITELIIELKSPLAEPQEVESLINGLQEKRMINQA
jgi:hypothetical protein